MLFKTQINSLIPVLLPILLLVINTLIIFPSSAQAVDLPLATQRENLINLENQKPATTDWKLTNPAINREIEGYASLTSVNRGGEIKLFINTKDPAYKIEIYRMGWYSGAGGRLMTPAIVRKRVKQPSPIFDDASGLVECNWKDPYILKIPNTTKDPTEWMSGVYLAKLTANKSRKQSYIIFVVRDDSRPSDILFQSSVTTFQAYNNWGGMSLYRFNSKGKQPYKVSFNRPYAVSPNKEGAYGVGAGEFLTKRGKKHNAAGWEYNMVRWLEKQGYDVTYSTNIDTHENPLDINTAKPILLLHKAFLSVGHDEYWSWSMRKNVEAARDYGVNLGFFSANTCYWQIRFEPSSVTKDINRIMVSYKENYALDPYARDDNPDNDYLVTTQWRRKPVNLPEDALLGVMYETFDVMGDIVVENTAPDWIIAGTQLSQNNNQASLWFSHKAPKELVFKGLLGYEVDRMFKNAPANTIRIARSPYRHKNGKRYSDMAVYVADSGAIVFATGSMQWSWALDDYNAPQLRPSVLNKDAQIMTRNILARMIR
ncbi:MAG: hypothetical protein KME64_29165 [Scytonematopsis contorta HA4267-MV1]|jgi:hypothetical protein|nr:hypothetical protein [Scytonematopsis contorta HA4267-MV1]